MKEPLGRFTPRVAIAVLAGLIPTSTAAQPAALHLKGKIVDDTGKPVPAGRVSYRRLERGIRGPDGKLKRSLAEPRAEGRVSSDAAGAFAVPLLPEGDYIACFSAPGFLRTCDWQGWHRLKLAPGQGLDTGTILLTPAATVTIRLNDPLGLLPAGVLPTLPLSLGIRDQFDHFHPAQLSSADKTGRTFQVGVPFGKPMKLWVQSWKLRFADAGGSPIDSKGARVPFQVAPGAAAPTFNLNIVGTIQ